jgi:hypothetical protein
MHRKVIFIGLITGIFSIQNLAFADLRAAWNFEDQAPGGVTADVSGFSPAMNATGQGTYSVVYDNSRNSYVLDPTAGAFDANGNPVNTGGFLANSLSKTQGEWPACTLSLWVKPKASQNGSFNAAVNEQTKFITGRINFTGIRMLSLNSGCQFWNAMLNPPADLVHMFVWQGSAWDPCDPSWNNTGPWHHLLLTFDSNLWNVYVDGVKFPMTDPNFIGHKQIGYNTGQWGISWHLSSNNGKSAWMVDDVAWFNGYIDDANVIALYNGTKTIYNVTAKEVSLPLSTSPPPADKLLFEYRMDEAVGSSILKDYSQNAGPRILLADGTGIPNPGIIDDPDRFRVLQMNYTSYRGDRAAIKQSANNFFTPTDKATMTWWANTIAYGDRGGWMVSQTGNGIRMERHFNEIKSWLTLETATFEGGGITDLAPEGGHNWLNDNEWHFFAIVFDSNCPPWYLRDDPNSWRIPYGAAEPNGAPKNVQMAVGEVYMDGVMINRWPNNDPNTRKHCGRLVGGEQDMWLLDGAGSAGPGLTGMIDDVRKYNAALTPEQVRYIYQTTQHVSDGIFVDTAYSEAPSNDPNKPGVVTVDQDIRWNPGKAASDHEIWFGTEGAMANQGTQARNSSSFDPAGDLLLDTVYEWKVNESNGASSWPAAGSWKFKTVNYLMLEDFETYTSDTTLRAVWKVTGTLCAGNPTLVDNSALPAERSVYHGAQAVKMSNIDLTASPYRAMYYKTLSTSINLSSANQNIKAFRVAFKGSALNKATSVCAYLKDSSNQVALINNPDGSATIRAGWTEWNVPLSEFTAANPSLNLASIKEYGVGVGTGTSVAGFTGGSMWFDDIRVFQPRCSATANKADVNGDCKVDIEDVNKIAFDWLDNGLIVGGGKLVALWRFEDGAGSSTAAEASSYSPTANGVVANASAPLGKIAATVPADDPNRGVSLWQCDTGFPQSYVNCDVDSGKNADKYKFAGGATISVWVRPKANPSPDRDNTIIGGNNGPGFVFLANSNKLRFHCGSFASFSAVDSPSVLPTLTWTHIAGVYAPADVNGPTVRLYINGNKVAEQFCIPNPGAKVINGFKIGNGNGKDTYGLKGKIDDVAMYNRALTTAEIRAVKNATTQPGFVVSTQSPLYGTIDSVGNVYKEAIGTDFVNFKDYSIVADKWLENPSLWP